MATTGHCRHEGGKSILIGLKLLPTLRKNTQRGLEGGGWAAPWMQSDTVG